MQKVKEERKHKHKQKHEASISSLDSSDESIELKIDNMVVTPTTFKRELEKKNEFRRDTYFRSCLCGKSDRRCLDYIAKLSISLIILSFSMTQIFLNTDPCNQQMPLYTSLLTLVIGFWLSSKGHSEDQK